MQPAQVVLRKAHNSAAISGEVRAKINEFASRGFRALGLAVADSDTGEGKCACGCMRSQNAVGPVRLHACLHACGTSWQARLCEK